MATIRLRWHPRVEPDLYRVYRDVTPIDPASLPTVLATLSGDASDYEDDTAADGVEYFYILAAVASTSPESVVFTANVSATGEGGPAPAPTVNFWASKALWVGSKSLPGGGTSTDLDQYTSEVFDDDDIFDAAQIVTMPTVPAGTWAFVILNTRHDSSFNDMVAIIDVSTDGGTTWSEVSNRAQGNSNQMITAYFGPVATGDQFRARVFNRQSTHNCTANANAHLSCAIISG